jgi:type IV fimbrial biogenesis protein FimT
MQATLRRHRGFTLLELMIAVAMLLILSALAFPSMRSFVVRNRVRDAATDVFLALNETRSEALKRNANVTLQPVSAGQWTSGWNIKDSGGNNVEVHQPLDASTLTVTGPANVQYGLTGRISGNTPPTFSISAHSGSYNATATITVDPSGRPYITEVL